MHADSPSAPVVEPVDDSLYRRRIRAWVLYDWANSAFATTIIGVFLPIYFSSVAAATLGDEATATAYWSINLSISLFISALLGPILGTVSDLTQGKKRLLAVFTSIGVIATALLFFVEEGDWLFASIAFIIARIGYVGGISLYDALLPHVARPEDQDAVSARGFAAGYLGGGLLLIVNIVVLRAFPQDSTLGIRLSFLSVAIWWAIFSLPLFRQVPEPPAAAALSVARSFAATIRATVERLRQTFRDLRRYRELFRFLVAFLIYSDGVGTIITLAAIYGRELGFAPLELVLAFLLVQFVAMPFSLIFGRLPGGTAPNRGRFLAFIAYSVIMLPAAGILARTVLPAAITGAPPLDGERASSLGTIFALLVVVQIVGVLFAFVFGKRLFTRLADTLDTRRCILIALAFYTIVALWGFRLDSTVEFWFLSWLIAIVQGGIQALSRSLYASLSPAAKSGEFFGFFGVMERFASILGPALFALAVAVFGSSRPAVVSLVAFFIVGGWLLSRVDIQEGQRVAREENAHLLAETAR